jgi:hypothetical protein
MANLGNEIVRLITAPRYSITKESIATYFYPFALRQMTGY